VAFAVVKLKTRDTIDQQDRRHSTPCGQHRFEFRIADEQEPTAEEVRDSFGADCLTGPRRAREIKGEREPSGMALPEPQRLKMRSRCVTWASARSSARRVAGGRITSSNVRRGTIDSTARPPVLPNNRVNGMGATRSTVPRIAAGNQ
jgi:hypothetical protein